MHNVMKKILPLLAIFISSMAISQKKGDAATEPWFEEFSRAPFQQGMEGTLLIEIKNTGEDVATCIAKAKQQAVFAVIFTGYTEANNIPAAPALSPTDVALYYEKQDFFKGFLSTPAQHGVFVPKAEPNPKKPVSKIDKKTVEAHIIVTVEVERLRKNLEAQGLIKSAMMFGFKPTVLIVPSYKWMKDNKYFRTEDNQGIPVEIYDFENACKDSKIYEALKAVANKLGGPNGAFEVKDMGQMLKDIAIREQINNARSQSKSESPIEVFYRVLKADLWIEVDLNVNSLEKGLKTQYLITLSAIDPYTASVAIPGKTIAKETAGDNSFQLMTNAMNGAVDEFKPNILSHFQNVATKGIQGKISFSLLDGLDFDFDTEIEYKDSELPLKEVLAKITKLNTLPGLKENIGISSSLEYSANIPFEYKDEDTGAMEKNSFTNVGNRIRSQVKKLGYNVKTEPNGLGQIDIIITGLKE